MPIKLTKHSQACIELDIDDFKIVIDPGVFDKHVDRIIKDADAVLVTHVHGDHLDPEAVGKALGENPLMKVYGPAPVAQALGSFGGRVIVVNPGDVLDIGSVHIQVMGSGKHAPVHETMSVTDNVCYLINDTIYHPGDSFDVPQARVETLLVPTSGPWMKTGEAADFIMAVKPERSISIHDAVDTEIGHQLALEHLGKSGITGIDLIQLKVGKSINL